MIKRLVSRLLVGVALTFAPVAEADAPHGIVTAQDLLDTCADTSAVAQAACESYVHATVQTAEIVNAVDHGGKLVPMFCPGPNMGAQDLIAVLRLQVAADPERKNFPAPTLIIGGGIDAYPCPKAPAPAAAAARKPVRRRAHPARK